MIHILFLETQTIERAMSKIKTTLYRSDDQRVLRVSLQLNEMSATEYAIVSFKCGETRLEIFSSSVGSIDLDGNLKISGKNTDIFVSYCDQHEKIECLVGYYVKNELKYHETLSDHIDNTKKVEDYRVSVPYLRTITGSYTDRLNDFLMALGRYKSAWKIELSCPDDILANIIQKGKDQIVVTLGEESTQLLASDFVFKIDPSMSFVNIPKSIIESLHEKYSVGSKIQVFEIIQPDFLGKLSFYKSPISNSLALSGIFS